MLTPLAFAPSFRHVLLVTAAPAEAGAVMEAFGHATTPDEWRRTDVQEGWSLVRTGVGKVNAAMSVGRCLAEGGEPGTLILNVGVCGSLPGEGGAMLPNGTVIVGAAAAYADEGVEAGDAAFTDMATMGFGYWNAADGEKGMLMRPDPAVAENLEKLLRDRLGESVRSGPIATVSTCSGTAARAAEVARRTGAVAEAMEGAAIGHALMRVRGTCQGFAEVRVVSNTTGDRVSQQWDLQGGLAGLGRVIGALRAGGGA